MTGRILCQYPAEPGNYSKFLGIGGININAGSCYCVIPSPGGNESQRFHKMVIGNPNQLPHLWSSSSILQSGKHEVALSFSERL